MPETLLAREFLCDCTAKFTQTIDFGLDMQSVVSGKVAMPPMGLRFNRHFEGELMGPKLEGKFSGIGYLYIRADGVSFLTTEGVIIASRGERIALHAEGIATVEKGTTCAQERTAFRLHTAAENYLWVNSLECWAVGTIDLVKSIAKVKWYSA